MATGTTTEQIEIRPQVGPQEKALACPADLVIMGGAAGGGKTWALLLEPIRHHRNRDFAAVIFRRTAPQITNPGGLWDESAKVYPLAGAHPRITSMEWTFPVGARVKFAHMEYEQDKHAWDGAQIPLVCFDQLESFTEGQFWYMLSRNRSLCGVRPYIRATCNPCPDDDPIGGWLHRLIQWWIDPISGTAIQERSGTIRWFMRVNDRLEWAESPRELSARHPEIQPKSLTFIPARLEDNKKLLEANPEYKANLLALPLVERERLLGGNWNVRPEAGKVFNRAWFEIVGAAPTEAQRVRGWDKAGTEGAGDWSAGVRVAKTDAGIYYVEDVIRGQWGSMARNAIMRQTAAMDGPEIEIQIEQEPGSGGKESAEISIRDLAGFPVYASPASGNKLTRAYPMSAQAEAGNIKIVRGDWNAAFLDELHRFTGADGGQDDQVDAAAKAFNRLALMLDSVRLLGGTGNERQNQTIDDLIRRDGVYWP